MDYITPEGWKDLYNPSAKIEKNKNPINSVGQPQLDEGEIVIEDGELRTRQYFLVQCPDGKIKAKIPGIKNGQDYVGPPKTTRQEALQDAFNMLNTYMPEEYLGIASKRTPNKVY